MKPRKIPYMLVTVSVLACIEVRLSLLEHHFFHQVIMNAVTQLKSYDLTQALLSGGPKSLHNEGYPSSFLGLLVMRVERKRRKACRPASGNFKLINLLSFRFSDISNMTCQQMFVLLAFCRPGFG